MQDRGHLMTEQGHQGTRDLDQLGVGDCFDLINAEDGRVAAAVAAARTEVVAAVELVVEAFRAGGRLFYVGAGTSGRLGVVDASECPPTFQSAPQMVQGVIAGGPQAVFRSVEGAEDSEQGGADALAERGLVARDVVFGIATGGTTPFVHGAIRHARKIGARTVFFACVPYEQCPDQADVSIRVCTGPEVVTGSTRMKAGTATKMVLNMVTTIAMVQLGKVYQNLMVDMNAFANRKLIDRAIRIVGTVTGVSRERARQLLDDARGKVKTAIVMQQCQVEADQAESLLASHGQHVGRVLAARRQ